MDTTTKEKAKALLNAGIDKDSIIEILNISLNDLERIDQDDSIEVSDERAPTAPNKITAENYGTYKKAIDEWEGGVNDCARYLGISNVTYYRIKNTESFEEYRKPRAQHKKRSSNMTKERFDAIKLGLSAWKGSNASYMRTIGVSQATLYRIKLAKDFNEYSRRARLRNCKQDEEPAGKPAETAIPKEEPKVEVKTETIQIAQPQELRFTTTQVEVLERIATQLERIADYEQMKLSKKRWFRK